MKTEVPEMQGVKQRKKKIRQRFNITLNPDVFRSAATLAAAREISFSRLVEKLLTRDVAAFNRRKLAKSL